jgi:hypothetical protein
MVDFTPRESRMIACGEPLWVITSYERQMVCAVGGGDTALKVAV